MRPWTRTTGLMVLAAFVAMSLASVTLMELTVDPTYLLYGIPVIAMLLGISAVSRRFSIHSGLIHLWQVLALAGSVIGLGAASQPGGGNPLIQVWHLMLDGLLHIQTTMAPMAPNPGTSVLFVLLIGLVTIIADALVLSLATPGWVAAPMLTLYLIPALAMRHPMRWWSFVALAAGFLIVLAADTSRDLSTWTRNLDRDNARRSSTTTGLWSMAALIGAPVLALSLIVGNILPTFGDLDLTSRRPRGQGPIQMQDPTIELNRNLTKQSADVVLTYNSDNPQGQYLRLASLTVLDRDSWKLTPVQLRDGDLSPAPGLDGSQPRETTRVQMGDFGSQYLPTPYAPLSFQAEGPWAFDPVSLMILSTAQNNTDSTRNLGYTVTSLSTAPDPVAFSTAKVGIPPDDTITSVVPKDVPQEIVDLTAEVTRSEGSPVLKAAAIQAWLRDPRRFTYSTEAPPGDGYEVIRNFLLEDGSGYCIHFASAMALMARISGIPSRVSIGFLPGEKKGDTWQVRGRDMHAWPELYFDNYGWVRFEPTAGVADAPMWTVVQGQSPTASPSASGGSSASSTPSSSPSSSSTPSVSASDETTLGASEGPQVGETAPGIPLRTILAAVGAALGIIALLLVPMLIRLLLRRRRFALTGTPSEVVEGLWTELRDTVADVRTTWPQGSPRQKAAGVGAAMDQPAQKALDRIAAVVERSRYSRGLDGVPDGFVDDVRYVTTDMRVKQTTGNKLSALLLPRSLFLKLLGRRP